MNNKTIRESLAEIKRKLGPYTHISRDQSFAQNDAELARQIVALIDVVDRLARQVVGASF